MRKLLNNIPQEGLHLYSCFNNSRRVLGTNLSLTFRNAFSPNAWNGKDVERITGFFQLPYVQLSGRIVQKHNYVTLSRVCSLLIDQNEFQSHQFVSFCRMSDCVVFQSDESENWSKVRDVTRWNISKDVCASLPSVQQLFP